MASKNNKKSQEKSKSYIFFPPKFALKMSDPVNYNNLKRPKPKSTENEKVIIYCL
jgi:hypothetical protein